MVHPAVDGADVVRVSIFVEYTIGDDMTAVTAVVAEFCGKNDM